MREQLSRALRPLVERMHRGHCWVKTRNGPRRIDEKFTEVSLSEHVMKGKAYGLCPVAPGETSTRVAVLDFDSHKGDTPWADMHRVAGLVATALEMDGYRPVLFRSSGGHGVHLYLTWADPQDAYSVRQLLCEVLEACELKPGTGGVSQNQVEVFPKQDEVAADGFGSMVILPFAGSSEPLGTFDGWPDSPAVPARERPPKVERQLTVSDDPGLLRIRGALDAIPNDTEPLGYEPWRNVIFAIHYATDGSDDGLALAHAFSARSGKHNPEFLDERVWPYINSDRGGPVSTERTLFALAEQYGWIDPAIADDFGVVEPEAIKPKKDKRFTFLSAAEFSAGRAPVWIIKDVLPQAELVVIYGESASGKSFFALDLCGAVARGVQWRGKRTAKLRVGYIAAEGAGGFRNRLKAYSASHEVALADLDITVLADAPNFIEKDQVIELVKAIQAAGPMGLIVVDTLAQVTPGANENAGEDMGRVIAHCRTIHKVTGATVILIHHSGKDNSKGARGWSGLRAAADAEIEITRADDDRVATVTKLKEGTDGAEFGFKLVTVPVDMDEDGDVVSSCVVEHGEASPKADRKKPIKGAMERRVWDAVLACQQLDGGHPTTSEVIDSAVNQTPFDANSGMRDARRQNALRALTSLVDSGRLSVVDGRVQVVEGNS